MGLSRALMGGLPFTVSRLERLRWQRHANFLVVYQSRKSFEVQSVLLSCGGPTPAPRPMSMANTQLHAKAKPILHTMTLTVHQHHQPAPDAARGGVSAPPISKLGFP